MKKNNKQIKMICTIFTFFLMMMPFVVNAKAAPSSIRMGSTQPATKSYIGPNLYYSPNILGDGTIAYCLEYKKQNPYDLTVKKSTKLSAGYQYLIENGYPAKSFTGDKDKDSYLTQIAIYWYHDRKSGIPDGKDGMIPAYYKQTAEDPYGLRPTILSLLSNAEKAEKNDKKPSTTLTVSNTRELKFSEDKKTFVSSLVSVLTNENLKTYKVSFSKSVPSAVILDESGKERTTFQAGEKFYIQVPVESLKNKENIEVKITGTIATKVTYSYSAGSSYQTITPPVIYEEEITATGIATFYPNFGSITVIKKDATTKEELAGAKLVLKDANGTVIAEWTTTTEAYKIDYLPFGEYTLEEISAPSNYVLSKEIIHITTSETDPTKETIMYNQPYIEVPDTSVKSSTVITMTGFVILVLGAGTIYAAKKKQSK